MTTATMGSKDTIIAEAKALTVKTASDRKMAADLWDALRKFRKDAEAQKEEVCRPLKTAWDKAKVPFDTFVKECQGHETRLQGLMSVYDKEQDRLAREEQAKIQAKIDAQNAKRIEKAETKGLDVSEVVMKVAPVVQTPPRSIETQAGTVSTRVEKKVYGIKDATDNEEIKANDPRIASIIAAYPALFSFDWIAFRKVASTGMLDAIPQVQSRIEYIYTQRAGR